MIKMKEIAKENQNKPATRKNQVAVDSSVDLSSTPKRYSAVKGDAIKSENKIDNSNKSNTIESDPTSQKIVK